MMVRDITNVVAIVEQQPLQSLIAEVRGCIRDLKSHEAKTPKLRVLAGQKLAALRERKEAEGVGWWPWFEAQDICSRAEAFRLLKIAGAIDPDEEEERQRKANAEHQKRHRESLTSETQPNAEEIEDQPQPPKKILVTCGMMIANAMLWLDPDSLEGSKKDKAFLLDALQNALPKVKAIIAELNPSATPAPDSLDQARDHYAAEFAKLPVEDSDAETDRLIQSLRQAS